MPSDDGCDVREEITITQSLVLIRLMTALRLVQQQKLVSQTRGHVQKDAHSGTTAVYCAAVGVTSTGRATGSRFSLPVIAAAPCDFLPGTKHGPGSQET